MKSIGFALITALMIFSAALMTVYAVTAYQRSEAELRLSESYASSVSAYYSADATAAQIMSRLKGAADIKAEVTALRREGTAILIETEAEGEISISYRIEVEGDSTLDVTLELNNRKWQVLKWSLSENSNS